MHRRVIGGALALLLLWSAQGHAQGIPVIDVANLAESTFQSVEQVLMVANQLLDLLALPEIVITDGAFVGDTADLANILQEASLLGSDLTSLQAQIQTLFSLDAAPNGSAALRDQMRQIRRVVFDCYVHALRVQTLLRTTITTLQHLALLIGSIEALAGNLSAQQVAIQQAALLNKTLAQLQAETTAFHQAQAAERLERLMVLESMRNINDAIMEDYPQ